jgi:hypothetical protein
VDVEKVTSVFQTAIMSLVIGYSERKCLLEEDFLIVSNYFVLDGPSKIHVSQVLRATAALTTVTVTTPALQECHASDVDDIVQRGQALLICLLDDNPLAISSSVVTVRVRLTLKGQRMP